MSHIVMRSTFITHSSRHSLAALLLCLCLGLFGYAIAQTFSTLGVVGVEDTSSTTVDLRLPALPDGATSLSLQRATGTKDAVLPPTSGQVLWLKADSISGVSDGGAVSRWESVGGSYHATQGDSGAQPSWIAQAVNGRPAVRFDGSTDYLSLPTGMKDFSQGLSTFVVTKPTANQHWARFFDFGNGSGSDNIFFARANTSNNLAYGVYYRDSASNPSFDGITNGQFQILEAVQQSGAVHSYSYVNLYRNGTPLGVSQALVPRILNRTSNFIGKSNWGDALFQGDIAEVLIYKKALSTTERQGIENYLASKYGLPASTSSLTWSTVATGLSSNAAYEDTGLSADSKYFYRAVAVNGTSNPTGPITPVTTLPLAPATPATPTFSDISATYLTVNAPSLSTRAINMALQQKLATESNASYVTIAQSLSGDYRVTGLTAETEYDFRLVAVGEGGTTVGTAASATTEEFDAPDAPAAPIIESVTSSSIELKAPALPARAATISIQRATGAALTTPPTSGLSMWLNPTSISTTDGAALPAWSDSSGQGNNATQTDPSLQPHWIANGLNGRPIIRMDGVDDHFRIPSVSNVRTAIVVARHNTGSQDWAPILGSPSYQFHGGFGTALCWWDYTHDPVKFGQGFVDGQQLDVLALQKPTSFQVISLTTTTGTTIDSLSTQDWITGRAWNGDFAEVLLYNRVLPSNEREQAENYLKGKYGLGTSSPGLSWTTIATGLDPDDTYTDGTLDAGSSYFYRCVAVGTSGNTPGAVQNSSTLVPAPATPASPTFTEVAATHLRVVASSLPSGASHFALQRKLTSESSLAYVTVTGNMGSSYVVTGLTAETSYDFRCIAFGDGGQTNGTAGTVETTEFDPPAVPDLPEAVAITSTSISLKTPALPDRATSLTLQRASIAVDESKPVSNGLKVWLDAGTLSEANGTSLSIWPDSSGNNNHAIQATYKSQPKIVTNGLNGHPVVHLDGGEDGVGDYFNLPSQTQIRTAIVVARHRTGYQDWAPILGSRVHNFHGGSGNNLFHDVYTSNLVTGGESFVNGDSINPLAITKPTQFKVITLGTAASTQVDFLSTQEYEERWRSWDGDFAEVLLYDRVLTPLERQETEAYLLNKYDLQRGALPGSPVWETVAENLAANVTCEDTGLTADKTYFYRCVAVGSGGETAGEALSVKTKAVAPETPDAPELVSSTATTATVQLPEITARAYRLQLEYKLHAEDASGYVIGATSDTGNNTVVISNLSPLAKYDFRAVAIGIGGTSASVPLEVMLPGKGTGTGLTGAYYSNLGFENSPVHVRVDSTIDFDWDQGSPVPGIVPLNNYVVRWSGKVEPLYSQSYKFRISGRDAFRLRVNGTLLVDVWSWGGYGAHMGEIALEKGNKYDIVLEYADRGVNGSAKLEWESASQKREVIPASQLYPLEIVEPNGLTAEYFDDGNLSDFFMKRIDPEINYQWYGSAPATGMGYDSFSIRWSGKIKPKYTENYTFTLDADNEARLWIDDELIVTAESGVTTGTVALTADHKHDIKVEYKEVDWDAHVRLFWESTSQAKEIVPTFRLFPNTVTMPAASDGNGLRGRYYQNRTFVSSDLMMNRVDPNIDFNWRFGSPNTDLPPHNFSVRWEGQVEPLFTEKYQFLIDSRDRCRVWVDNTLLIDRWNTDVLSEPYGDIDGSIELEAGEKYDLKVEYADANNGDGQARIKLLWTSASQFLEAIPQTQLFTLPGEVKLGNGTGLLASYYLNQQRYHVKVTVNPPPASCPETLSWELDEFPNQFNRKVDSYVVPEINFDWGNSAPWGGGDDFTARWEGEIEPLYSETYTFKTETDDGVRLWVNGELLIDDWIIGGARNHEDTIALVAGQKYNIVMEMFDARNGQTGVVADSKAKLFWSSTSQGLEIVPQRQLYPAATEIVGYGTGLRGHYYNNADHTDLEDVRIDEDIDFDWSTVTPFSMNRNTFAVRWVGYIASTYSEPYRFMANTDDQVKVWIGDQLIIDNEKNPIAKFGEIRMIGGVKTPIVVEFVQSEGEAHLSLEWESQHQEKQVVPTAQLYTDPDLQMQPYFPSCASANACAPCPSIPDIYDGHVTKVNVPSRVKAGETFTAKVWFKNTGQKPWVPGFGTDKVYGLSDQGFLWGREGEALDRAQTLYLETPYVAPGDVGEFTGTMNAPSTTGIYDASWAILVNGGRFTWSQNLRVQVLPAIGSDTLAAPRVLKTSDTSTTLKIPQLTSHSEGVTLQRFKQSSLEEPVSTGLKMWLKADDLSAIKTGESLPQWSDLSGQTRHATQSNAALRPVKRSDAVNGRPAVRFDGKDDYMEFPVTNDIRTVFIVVRDREENKNKGTILGNRLYGGDERFVANGTTNMFTWWNGPILENGVGAVNGYQTPPIEIKKSADFQVVSIQTTASASAEYLAHGFNSTISPWDGDIAELLIYDSVLSAGDKRSVEAYLTAKYGRPTAYEPVSPTWTTIGTTYNGGEEYVDSGLDANSTYWYRCVPIEVGADPGKSAHTTTLSEITAPDAPDAPTFSEVGAASVKVHAPELPATADYLTLQIREEAAPVETYRDVEQVIVPEGFVVVNKLDPLTEYAFRYVATNQAGATAGDEDTVTTLELAPDVPDAPSIQTVGQFDATLKMPALPLRAETLQLQMKAEGAAEYVTVDEDIDAGETYSATGLSQGQSYLFRCIAVNETGSTPGLVAALTTDLPLPGAPKRPKFSALTDTTIDVTAPILPAYAISLSLQVKPASAPNTAFTTIASGLAANSVWSCTNLQPGMELEFRYLAVNWTGTTAGQSGGVTMLVPEVTWSAGTGIDCLGIRFPEAGQSVTGGSIVNLNSYLATDFDVKQVLAGVASKVTNHSDTCTYTWTASAGSFVDGVNTGQKAWWTAPTTPGTYTIGLTVDDQGGANKKTTEGGSRNDASDGYDDAPQKYQVTITVLP